MIPQVVKYQVWNLALQMNPQPAIYLTRVPTETPSPGGSDSQSVYSLLRVTYDDLNRDEIAMAGATLEDALYVFVIYQVDLDNSNAPAPKISYQLSFSSGPFAGTTWTMVKVPPITLNAAFRCVCQQARPQ